MNPQEQAQFEAVQSLIGALEKAANEKRRNGTDLRDSLEQMFEALAGALGYLIALRCENDAQMVELSALLRLGILRAASWLRENRVVSGTPYLSEEAVGMLAKASGTAIVAIDGKISPLGLANALAEIERKRKENG